MVIRRSNHICPQDFEGGKFRLAGASPSGPLPSHHYSSVYRLLAALLGLVVLGCGLLGGAGCTSHREAKGGWQPAPEPFVAHLRVASGGTSRLLSNARYYNLMGRPDLALKQLEEAYRQDPQNLQVVNTLARSYEETGKFELARKLYQEAQERQGYHPVLSNNSCFSYYLEGKWEQAESCFRQVLARDPGNTAALNNLGLVWCRQGRVEEARRLWEQAMGEDAAAAKLGQALAALGMAPGEIYARMQKSKVPARQQAGAPAAARNDAKTFRGSPASRAVAAAAPGPTADPGKGRLPGGKLALSHRIAYQQPAMEVKETAGSPGPRPSPEGQKSLSVAELVDTAIEVRNGTPTPHLARRTRALLSREGFSVARIGNHIDFGAERTTIYYRARAARVAQAVRTDFFPQADLQVSSKLKKDVDIKIILGHDLLERPQLLVRWSKDGE